MRGRHGFFRAKGGSGAGAQRNDPVRHVESLIHIIRDEDDRLPRLLPNLQDLVLKHRTRQRIERAQRLVEQQHFGLRSQRARHGHSLLHAPGKLTWKLVRGMGELHHRNGLLNTDLALSLGLARKDLVHGQGDVFPHREPRQQRVVLKHQSAIRPRTADRRTVHRDGTHIRLLQAGDQVHQGALAAAGVADDRHELSGLRLERDVLEDSIAVEGFRDLVEFNHE